MLQDGFVHHPRFNGQTREERISNMRGIRVELLPVHHHFNSGINRSVKVYTECQVRRSGFWFDFKLRKA